MPELPEVEVVRRGVDRWLVGHRLDSVRVLHPRAVRRHSAGARDFERQLCGVRVLAAQRRGKYLWLRLDSAALLLVHLGMSGQLLFRAPDEPAERHLRARFDLGPGERELRFVDQRTFGHLRIDDPVTVASPHPDVEAANTPEVPASIAHIAPDPLEPAFDTDVFAARLARRGSGIKRALLDQSLVSGVGNIYADEALWLCSLHGEHPCNTLTRARVGELVEAVRGVMSAALRAGGTSFDSLYVDVNGQSGYFSRSLHVYGRAGEPCARCATPVQRAAFMNRSSFWCPACQPVGAC
ncbi:bifunctional DNA-formamidopyrimidine glycosylase/DNA-(apurinic or apyrimidinic site) lyase [Lipingzhangella sp. LS1_29]|uniref:Formamidopyrimidine-DNA glycosylase n=1 Tax=Lipingzhangella rawalii TaxID=2055835 RepID=A0ABU2H7R3_9ACTN|nr:bifunctional DNA-formamidopyrimidine glycosylase/DNA-(apurinic or apyrimidinic site) lyase [Lipingzhangella rawalii]MDS1270649.1 bifunctional DNA-formamidopyrimidine glycosylase/DNA-(apurinic or apyrimidinic site) lyase [Lipingzhangella rawalii]